MISRLRLVALAAAGCVLSAPHARAQVLDPAGSFRVFLSDGRWLPSYGEYALVDSRIVFMLPVGSGARLQLQLMSLPVSQVAVDRTARYADAVLAASFAATRGESEYAALTAEVSRALDLLTRETDPRRRLALARESRQRLVSWSAASHGYRAADVQELVGLFDEVIAELSAAAGESAFAIDLSAGPDLAPSETLQPPPALRESVELALTAASLDDLATERLAILRTASSVVADDPELADLGTIVRARLDDEAAADRAYAALSADIRQRAALAVRRGALAAVLGLERELASRDRALGVRRPALVRALAQELDADVQAASDRQQALAHWVNHKASYVEYEKAIRPVFTGIDGIEPVLNVIREMTGPGMDWIARSEAKLQKMSALIDRVTPPEDLRAVHETLASAVSMAREACSRRRVALISANTNTAQEASAAAAGAQLLAGHAREELLTILRPPKVQ